MILTTISNDLSYSSFSMVLLVLEVIFVILIRYKQPFKKPDFKYINQALILSFYLFIPTAFYLFVTFFSTLPVINEYKNDLFGVSLAILGGLFLLGVSLGFAFYSFFWSKNKTKIDLEERTDEGYFSYYRSEKYMHINSFSLTSLIISTNICITIGCFILSLFAITGYYH